MPVLKVKTNSGQITTITVDELIEVDGRPHRAADETAFLQSQIARLQGRIDVIETAIFGAAQQQSQQGESSHVGT